MFKTMPASESIPAWSGNETCYGLMSRPHWLLVGDFLVWEWDLLWPHEQASLTASGWLPGLGTRLIMASWAGQPYKHIHNLQPHWLFVSGWLVWEWDLLWPHEQARPYTVKHIHSPLHALGCYVNYELCWPAMNGMEWAHNAGYIQLWTLVTPALVNNTYRT